MLKEKEHIKFYHEIQNKEINSDFLKAYNYFNLITSHKVLNCKDGWYPSHSYEAICRTIGKSRNTLINYVRKCQDYGMVNKKGKHGFATVSPNIFLKKRNYEKYEHKGKRYYAYRKLNVSTVNNLNYNEITVLNELKQLYNQQAFRTKNETNKKGYGMRKQTYIKSDNVAVLQASLRYIIKSSTYLKSLNDDIDLTVSFLNQIIKGLIKKGYVYKKVLKDTPIQLDNKDWRIGKKEIPTFTKVFGNGMYVGQGRIIYQKGISTFYFDIDGNILPQNKSGIYNPYSDELQSKFTEFINENKELLKTYGIINSDRKVSWRQYNSIVTRLIQKLGYDKVSDLFLNLFTIRKESKLITFFNKVERYCYEDYETFYTIQE